MVKLVVIAIHGIGNHDRSYYNTFENRLRRYLQKESIPDDEYIFRGIQYSKVFEKEADKISEMTKDLRWKKLRRFISHSLGDALAYQSGVSATNRIDFYQKVHDTIDKELLEISQLEQVSDNTAILFIAHSMGAYVISNYIWDKQNKKDTEETPFLNMDNLCGLVTMGCNIPILTLGFDYDKLYPITLPGENLMDIADAEEIEWINIYDKSDPLAIPMENFYSYETEYQKKTLERIRDVEMNVGNILVRYTPISHTKYWNHGKFIDLVKGKIIELLDLL